MNMYDVKCPKCGKVITRSNLSGGKSNLLCSSCHIRFDIKCNFLSSKTGAYSYANVRNG